MKEAGFCKRCDSQMHRVLEMVGGDYIDWCRHCGCLDMAIDGRAKFNECNFILCVPDIVLKESALAISDYQ